MHKNTRYSKIDRYCDICECNPCDCDGVWDEFRIMGSIGTTKTRQEPYMAREADREPSLPSMQVEKRPIESENRVLFSSVQRDIQITGDTTRIYTYRRRRSDGDSD